MVYHRSWRLPTISSWKHSKALSNTLGSPVGGGGFNPRRQRRGTAAHPSEACSGTSRDALLEASRLAF